VVAPSTTGQRTCGAAPHEHLVFDRPLYSDRAQHTRFRTLLLLIILAPELLHAADVFLIDNMIVALRH
jgi:hypothetical protein